MQAVGIDGCKSGWFVVAIAEDKSWAFAVHKTLDALLNSYPEAHLILIDIPIGLPSKERRACDVAARRLLTRIRASSVFPVPCRSALYAADYQQACRLNEQCLGVRLSRQAWNICRKIAEVDRYLERNPDVIGRLRESHPELCFWGLAGGRPLAYSKRTEQGLQERLALLASIYPAATDLYRQALIRYPRKLLARDDILDALVLAVCAGIRHQYLTRVPETPEWDERGLPMEIVFSR